MSKTGEATVQIKRDAKFRFFDTLSWRSLDQPYQPAREMGSEAHRMSEKHVAGLSHRNIPVEVNLWQLFYPMGSRLFFCRDLLKTILQNGGAMLKCRGWCWSGTFQCLRSLSLKDFPILKGENYSWYLKNLSFPSLVWIFPLPRISEGPSHVTDWIIELGQPYSKLLNHRRVLSLLSHFSHSYHYWLEHFLFFHILEIIIPTDELIFFRGVGIPPTRLISLISPWEIPMIGGWIRLGHPNFPLLQRPGLVPRLGPSLGRAHQPEAHPGAGIPMNGQWMVLSHG